MQTTEQTAEQHGHEMVNIMVLIASMVQTDS